MQTVDPGLLSSWKTSMIARIRKKSHKKIKSSITFHYSQYVVKSLKV